MAYEIFGTVKPVATKQIVTPTYTLPTIPATKQFVAPPAAAQVQANKFDWGAVVNNLFPLAGKIIDLQTAKANASNGIQTYQQPVQTVTDNNDNSSAIGPVALIGGAALITYLVTR